MRNAVDANFASYVVSTGHTPVAIPDHPNAICEEGLKTMSEHCEYSVESQSGPVEMPGRVERPTNSL